MASQPSSKKGNRRSKEDLERRKRYQALTRKLAFSISLILTVTIISVTWLGSALNSTSIFGFPFGLFMTVNGAFIFSVATIFWALNKQQTLDEQFKHTEDT